MYSHLSSIFSWDALPQERKNPQHYFTMNDYEHSSVAITDSTRYPCYSTSIPYQDEKDGSYSLDLPNRSDFPNPNQLYSVPSARRKDLQNIYPRVSFSNKEVSNKEVNQPQKTDTIMIERGLESTDEEENNQNILQKEGYDATSFEAFVERKKKPSRPIPTKKPIVKKEMCTLKKGGLPVMDFRHNVREICKQLCLLEDHLIHWEKRCIDCCVKHFLMLEGLAEEALTLDSQGLIFQEEKWQSLQHLPSHVRSLQQSFWVITTSTSLSEEEITSLLIPLIQSLRSLRKQWMTMVFTLEGQEKESCGSSVLSCENRTIPLK